MCGRFTITLIEDIIGRFGIVLEDGTEIGPRFNIAPSQQIPVVIENAGGRQLRFMDWGFEPAWFKRGPNRPPPINARAESLLERPMFRDAVLTGRCIIPADGYFEWRTVPGDRRKQPMYIRLTGGELFGFAGLYTIRRSESGPVATCAIVTTPPNELMAAIHHRMPAILAAEDEAVWLSANERDTTRLLDCLQPYPSDAMEAFPVSRLVSYTENDEPAVVQPLLGTL
jgi:putative SOS response-associated peptidase YedK